MQNGNMNDINFAFQPPAFCATPRELRIRNKIICYQILILAHYIKMHKFRLKEIFQIKMPKFRHYPGLIYENVFKFSAFHCIIVCLYYVLCFTTRASFGGSTSWESTIYI